MEEVLEGKGMLDDTQMGFRKGRGTAYAIYIVSKAIEMELQKKGGKLYAFFA